MNPKFYFAVLFVLLAYTQGAAQCWKLQTPSFPHETISDVYFADAQNGFMAANAGIIGRTTDGGITWVPLETPTYENLRTITAASTGSIWCGGYKGVLLHSTDKGFRWSLVNFGGGITVQSISFPTVDTGFICGDSCIYKTVNNGSSWTKTNFAIGTRFSYIKFFNKDTGYAYYQGKLLKSNNGGSSWTTTTTKFFQAIEFANKNIGYAILDSLDYDNYYKTIDGGLSWFKTATFLNYYHAPRDMHVYDTANVYIIDNGVGLGNTRIYNTSNGGQSWANNNFTAQTHWATAIWFTSPTTGFLADLWGSCRKTTDRTNSWTAPNDYYGFGMSITAPDSLHIIQTGNVYQKRTTDGKNWTTTQSNSFGEWFVKVQFKSISAGFALTDNDILAKTVNAGNTWTFSNPVGTINDFSFYSPTFGIATKNGAICRTYNGGTSWTTATFSSTNFQKVACADSLHWFVTTDNNEIYRSSNGGVTWSVASTTSTGVSDLVATDSNTVFYTDGSNFVYLSTNKAQSFSASPSLNSDFGVERISAISTTKAIALSKANLIPTTGAWPNNNTRLYMLDNTGWHLSPIHTSFPHTAIAHSDSTYAWLTTSFGSIYKFYPAGKCPPDVLVPFLNTAHLKACANSTVLVPIQNYLSYNLPYDTLRAVLISGSSTVLWTGTPNSSGQLSVPIPATSGTYTLKITVTNPDLPSGIATTIQVTPLFLTTPQVNKSYTSCATGCCAGTQVQMSIGSVNNMGTGYTYELHMIKKGGADSVISTNLGTTIINNTSDSFKLYYKFNLGTDICYTSNLFYTDTVAFNINQPALAKANLNTTSEQYVCLNSTIPVKTISLAVGTSNRYYKFFQITPTGINLLKSGTDSTLSLTMTSDTVSVYCKMYPGTGGCNLPDTAITDTMTFYSLAKVPVTMASTLGADSICQGKSLTLYFDTSIAHGFSQYILWRRDGATIAAVDTGLSYYTVDLGAKPGVSYYFTIDFGGQCSIMTDTLYPVITAPKKATLQLLPNNDIKATPVNASSYKWFKDAAYLTTTSLPTLTQPVNGTYIVQVTMADSCIWLDSDPLTVTSVEKLGKGKWSIYPNPASGYVWIKLPGDHKDVAISIYDVAGVCVHRATVNAITASIDIRSLKPGAYFVKISDGQAEENHKLVVLPY